MGVIKLEKPLKPTPALLVSWACAVPCSGAPGVLPSVPRRLLQSGRPCRVGLEHGVISGEPFHWQQWQPGWLLCWNSSLCWGERMGLQLHLCLPGSPWLQQVLAQLLPAVCRAFVWHWLWQPHCAEALLGLFFYGLYVIFKETVKKPRKPKQILNQGEQ